MSQREIFIAAIQKPVGAERRVYLDQACAGDESLRSEVDALIEAHEQAGKFLQRSDGVFAQTVIEPRIAEGPGTVIGLYRLLEQIGEGGFGVVFMAEQSEPVRRKVALKVIKPGMDSRQVIARFEAERQALALMDHPHIAKVLDAGTTESGRPYFVMELVRGIPITEFCDQHSLTVKERLELFISVCHAAQHAHQKGIIHRDIKPSNVLVTLHDDQPVVKVIDFGVAKATSGQLTDKTLFTGFMQMLGTPLYMSPEQTALSGIDVDTRSDIYSLGVLLYELLTGTTPFDRKLLEKAAFDEIRRIIREEEPKKPSTRVSTLGDTLPDLCAQRKVDPRKFSQVLKGDLDWIVMKALEKDRTRRYETANGFARDIQRYLHDELVEARPPSAGYRLQKVMRRNKVALMTAGLVALSLIVGTVVSASQAIRARNAEEEARFLFGAESDARKEAEENLKQARDAVDVYFTQVSQSKLFNYPGLQPLRKDLLESAVRYYEAQLKEHGDDPIVLADLASTHFRVAVLYNEIGRTDETVVHLEQAAAIVERLFRDYPDAKDARLRLAGFWKGHRQMDLGGVAFDHARAIAVGQRLIPLWEKLEAENPDVLSIESDLAVEYFFLASAQTDAGLSTNDHAMVRTGIETGKKAIAIWERLAGLRPQNAEFRESLTLALLGNAWSMKKAGMKAKSDAANARALKLAEQLVAESPNVPQYRVFVIDALSEQGSRLEEEGKRQEATEIHQKRLHLASALMAEYPTVPRYEQLVSSIASRIMENSPALAGGGGRVGNLSDLGSIALLSKESTRDASVKEESIAGRLNGTAWKLVASLQKENWQPDRAVAIARMAVGLSPNNGNFWNTLGVARYRAGNWKGAESALRKSMALQSSSAAYDWIFLAMCLWQQGQKERARIWYEGACVLIDEYGSNNTELLQFRAESAELLGLPKEPSPDQKSDRFKVAENLVAISPDDPTVLRLLALALAEREDWSRSAAEFAKVVQTDELGWYTWYELALSTLAAKNSAGYQQACTEMYDAFGQSTYPSVVTFVIWSCALGPQATAEYAPWIALADTAAKSNSDNWEAFKNLGGILFRAGRYEEAALKLAEANRLAANVTNSMAVTSSPIYIRLFLAMTHHRLGHADEARKWLDISAAEFDSAFREHENGTMRMSWNRRVTLRLLRQEAESLINGTTTPSQPPTPAPAKDNSTAKP